jgi:hypothetical protein
MNGSERCRSRGWTRARVLRGALGGGALIAGGVVMGAREGGTSLAAPSKQTDAEILRVLLLLERVQEAFYAAALDRAGLGGPLRRYAETVGRQESEHVAILTEQLGGSAPSPPKSDFGNSVRDPDSFRDAAIELEEGMIAAYIGQGANLTREAVGAVAGLVGVEARQAAWVRDLAGVSPAPRAADPARQPEEVVADLRKRGFIQ